MDQHELTALISQTAQLMEQFERRCGDTERQLELLLQQMAVLREQLPAVIRQSADTSLKDLPPQVIQAVRGDLENTAVGYRERLHASASEIADGSRTMVLQINRMEKLHKHLVWKIVGATTTCLLLLLGGGLWLSFHYTKIIRDNQHSAQLMRAYNKADVTLCDTKLCANIDPKAPRYGTKRQYILVKPR